MTFGLIFALLIQSSLLFLFITDKGLTLRKTIVSTILSTQHRDLAYMGLIKEEETLRLLKRIQEPPHINSVNASNIKEQERALKKMKEIDLTPNDNQTKEDSSHSPLFVTIETIEEQFYDHYYKGKIMIVSNPANVKLATSNGTQGDGYGEQLAVIANNEGAIAATNAGGFYDPNGNGTGGIPIGIVIENHQVVNTPGGSDEKDYVAGFTDKHLLVTGVYSSDELTELNIRDAAGFKPQLIVNGKGMITEGNGGWGYGPRTAIGQTEEGKVVFVVIDGRQSHSIGASLKDVQDILLKEGVVNALSMDGGSSSVMFANGDYLTRPSSYRHIPRYIPNAWVVVPKKKQTVSLMIDGKKVRIKNKED